MLGLFIILASDIDGSNGGLGRKKVEKKLNVISSKLYKSLVAGAFES